MKVLCSCLATVQQTLNEFRQMKEDNENACGTK